MNTVLLCAIVAVVLFELFMAATHPSFGDVIGFAIVSGVVGGCIGLFLAVFLSGGSVGQKEWVQVESQPLYAANDTTSTTGHWFLFAGTVESQNKYSYWRLNSDGSKSWDNSIPKNLNTKVFEENRKDGVLLTFDQITTYRQGWVPEEWVLHVISYNPRRWEFHVPYGTINEEFAFK